VDISCIVDWDLDPPTRGLSTASDTAGDHASVSPNDKNKLYDKDPHTAEMAHTVTPYAINVFTNKE